jgi:hypothetical protein
VDERGTVNDSLSLSGQWADPEWVSFLTDGNPAAPADDELTNAQRLRRGLRAAPHAPAVRAASRAYDDGPAGGPPV